MTLTSFHHYMIKNPTRNQNYRHIFISGPLILLHMAYTEMNLLRTIEMWHLYHISVDQKKLKRFYPEPNLLAQKHSGEIERRMHDVCISFILKRGDLKFGTYVVKPLLYYTILKKYYR